MTELDIMHWKVQYYRRKAGLGQDTLALKAGLYRNTVYHMERYGDEFIPSLRTILKVTGVLGVSVAELFTEPTVCQQIEMRKLLRARGRTVASRAAKALS